MLRVLPLGVAAVGAIAAFWFVAGRHLERTSWQLTETPQGSELHVAVWLGGCDSFDSFVVRETDEDVQLQAYIDRRSKSSCDAMIRREDHSVSLHAALGDRPLLGCNPQDSAYPTHGGQSNEECERMAPYGR